MIRRLLIVAATVAAGLGGLLGAAPAHAATTYPMFLTFYGWYDNTPPGGDIAYPQIHGSAGGRGTFADPITFATSSSELSPGTKVWVPRVRKYFIMEDSCQECHADWTSEGPNGGPGLRHIDLWIGGQGGSAFDAIDCEDALTHYNSNGTPTMEDVIVNPASDLAVDSTPLFNTSTGDCYGGAQPNVTIGSYRNGSNGQCLEDPNNSSTSGTSLRTAACNGSAAQRFLFHGAFLVINDLCATDSSGTVKIVTCTGGPAQQWSINPNGTITDIQTGGKCVRASGTTVIAGSCSGSAAQWVFTPAQGFAISLSPASATADPGGSVSATVSSTLLGGTAEALTLSATGAPAEVTVGFTPPSITTGQSSALSVEVSGTVAPGGYPLQIVATSPTSTKTATFTLTIRDPNGPTRYEAENATISQGMVASNHLNFSGAGFVNCDNVTGSYVQFSVTAATAGPVTVRIRYANGTTADRPAAIAVNGTTVVSGQSFNPTTNWDTWADVNVTLNLAGGANTVRLTGTTATGPANIDYIEVGRPAPGAGLQRDQQAVPGPWYTFLQCRVPARGRCDEQGAP